ncbi:zinc finger, CCHC-type containing protein [Tanacetum coccineum]
MSCSNLSLLSLALLLSIIPHFASASLKEETALLKWKASLQIPNNSQILSSWTPLPMNSSATARCPSWFGIVCNADGNIYKLNLTMSELNGTLHKFPFSILRNLTHFELSVNSFFGPIPPEIGLLSKLVYLDFSANQFSGPIPPEIGMLANLETLHLNENNFNGSIPREIGQLTSLLELALYSNSLQGELPTTLGNLRKLAYLYLDDNELSGQIPPEFGQLVNLLEVYITNNFLEGPIPPTVGKLSKLKVLYLFNNSLTGSIPHEMGSMVSLESLSLSSNNLSGLIPSSLGDLTSLNLLHLYKNKLSGPIPIELGNLQSLTDLSLSENKLNGSIPSSLKNLINLQRLYVRVNKLSGPIPEGLGEISKLVRTRKWYTNQLLALPDDLCQSLVYLDVSITIVWARSLILDVNARVDSFRVGSITTSVELSLKTVYDRSISSLPRSSIDYTNWNSGKVYKLIKALYGLRQAPRAWNVKLDQTLKSLDFKKCNLEQAVYTKRSKTFTLIVGVYVDDLIIMGTPRKEIDAFKSQMKDRFEMSDLGLLAYYLGIEVTQTGGEITIKQTGYINKILKETSMMDSNETKIPMDPGTKLVKAEDGNSVDATYYRSLIGSLRYLLHTRPDLSYSVGLLSRFMQDPKDHHLKAVKQVIRYIKGTKEHGIIYKKEGGCKITGYSDSSYGINTDQGKGTTGIVFYFGESPITWCTQKQPTVALSSCESEFMAATGAACQALWLKRLLSELTGREEERITLKVDNISAIALVRNPVFHGRSKHIDIRYHFIRECVENGHINVEHVSGELQRADILTKALPRLKFMTMRQMLGVQDLGRSKDRY